MQQPDYNSSSYPNNNINNNNNNYASAPPFIYPSPDQSPHFPLIPIPTPPIPHFPNPNPNSPHFNNPNPNSPQFSPNPPQFSSNPPQFTNYQANNHQIGSSYPQLGQIETNYPKFDQFGGSGSGYLNSQSNSGSGYENYDNYGKSRADLGNNANYANNRVENNANYGNNRVDSVNNANYGNYSNSRVDSGLGFGGYDNNNNNNNNNNKVNSGTGFGNYPSFSENYGINSHSRADSLNTEFSNLGLSSSSGIYPYTGSGPEPYGSRGTGPKSWQNNNGPLLGRGDSGPVKFDDFGRPIGDGGKSSGGASGKVVQAVPKAESVQDEKGGVQKFRVKLLAESGGQTTMDVLCQIGLDGIRMLDPPTSRTLRIYPLETVTRFEVLDSSIFAFWAKTSVDIEPRRIRLKSNSYTSSTILDIVTAATIQFKEIGGSSRPSDSMKPAEQPSEKKKGLGDWINLMKPGNEEKDHWVPDEAVAKCTSCATDFGAFVRRHHCRNCGDIFCDKCTHGRIALTAEENAQPVRVCDRCLAEVTHRLNIAKESSNRSSSGLQSHEDLAKKLQEEMERNRRASSGSRSDGSGRRMKEVACPTCTVHLQVQVPSSGSETIECGVCQNPFLVSSR